mmetsp:Transcript_41747/g.163812  ORF Transcript_41747/g.163812 Transcript_41747/m.163812 type:complete len:86 (-) Transcript_41747:345-602(-)
MLCTKQWQRGGGLCTRSNRNCPTLGRGKPHIFSTPRAESRQWREGYGTVQLDSGARKQAINGDIFVYTNNTLRTEKSWHEEHRAN